MGGLTPGGREQHWASCHFYSFCLWSLPRLCHHKYLNWEREKKPCPNSIQNQKTCLKQQQLENEGWEMPWRREHRWEALNYVCKLYPNRWLILELYLWEHILTTMVRQNELFWDFSYSHQKKRRFAVQIQSIILSISNNNQRVQMNKTKSSLLFIICNCQDAIQNYVPWKV